MGFDSYLLAEDGLLLRYVPQIDDEEGGPTDNPFQAVIPRRLCTSSLANRWDGPYVYSM